MATNMRQWLFGERHPASYYELLGLPLFDPSHDRLAAALRAASRELQPYERHNDPAVFEQAVWLQKEVGRAAAVFSDVDKLRAYHEQLVEEIRQACDRAMGSGLPWSPHRLRKWLRKNRRVHPSRLEEIIAALAPREKDDDDSDWDMVAPISPLHDLEWCAEFSRQFAADLPTALPSFLPAYPRAAEPEEPGPSPATWAAVALGIAVPLLLLLSLVVYRLLSRVGTAREALPVPADESAAVAAVPGNQDAAGQPTAVVPAAEPPAAPDAALPLAPVGGLLPRNAPPGPSPFRFTIDSAWLSREFREMRHSSQPIRNVDPDKAAILLTLRPARTNQRLAEVTILLRNAPPEQVYVPFDGGRGRAAAATFSSRNVYLELAAGERIACALTKNPFGYGRCDDTFPPGGAEQPGQWRLTIESTVASQPSANDPAEPGRAAGEGQFRPPTASRRPGETRFDLEPGLEVKLTLLFVVPRGTRRAALVVYDQPPEQVEFLVDEP